ncbi:MAG TPA: crotonase/enoyl-CoA hydratase family protein [Actinomycetota bacterium]|nr:crotonase/enoyl-CoA hydratase family protein [Actinomycetota bacterium]
MTKVRYEPEPPLAVVTIDRPEVRNAVDPETAEALVEAFAAFDADPSLSVAIFTGAGGHFCGGFDLKALARGDTSIRVEGRSPMGPARMLLSKPVIAAVEGYAVGGGFELALWCDLRVASRSAVFGVFNRRFGVPLIDGGTVRLPRLIGHSRAMDVILTGRAVSADEAFAIGLVNRLVDSGRAMETAVALGQELSRLPQTCLRSDRLSAHEQWPMPIDEAIANEWRRGVEVIASGESTAGAARFAEGAGRHGEAGV